MRIAVNAIFLQKGQLEGYGQYAREITRRLVQQHPEHEFIFIFDRPYDPEFVFADNVIPVVTGPAARHALAFKYWYDVKAPLALRKYKPDVWLQPYGFCSLSTSIPQILIVHDLAFKHHPDFIAWHHRSYYQAYTGRFLKKAAHIITVSEFSKQDIISRYATASEKISVAPGAARAEFVPVSWQEKQSIKDQFSSGTEYFLCTGGIHPRKNLMNLLKAFSLFKKWQHSNMKLLIAGRLAWQYEEIVEKLKTYKYRDDVVLTGYLPDDQLARLTAGAYAMVYPSWFEGFGLPIVEAMQAGVPVIASNTSSMPEAGGEAALYADPADPDSIAKHMLSLYRDETFRSKLIEAGYEQAKKFSWDRSAQQIWNRITGFLRASAPLR
ncbi:MAG: glycosyltransferase family 4 protein [Chitinophagaceae bacterium]|nr:glycosyltransferase family 4 protein [Chitinophagaceae bacterium]